MEKILKCIKLGNICNNFTCNAITLSCKEGKKDN